MDFETCNELRRKKLYFTCRETWTPDHRCLGKGKIHFVEVHSEEEEEVEEPQEGDNSVDSEEEEEVEGQPSKDKKKKPPIEQPPVLATVSSDPACHPFRVKGVVRG